MFKKLILISNLLLCSSIWAGTFNIEINPMAPVVSQTDLVVNDFMGQREVKAPWTHFHFYIQNGMSENVLVRNAKVTFDGTTGESKSFNVKVNLWVGPGVNLRLGDTFFEALPEQDGTIYDVLTQLDIETHSDKKLQRQILLSTQ